MNIVSTGTYISDADLALFDNTYTTFALTTRNACRLRAYDMVNAILARKVATPLRLNSVNSYDGFVKDMQTAITLWYLYSGKDEEKKNSFWSMVFSSDRVSGIADRFLAGALLLEEQITGSRLGIQPAAAASGNTGSGKLFVDTTIEYTGLQRLVYTVEITTAGAGGTAKFRWKTNKDTTWTQTGQTTDNDFLYLDNNVRIYFIGNETTSFNVPDSWTITCVPMSESTQDQGLSTGGMIPTI